MSAQKLPVEWEGWCKKGKDSQTTKKRAALNCLPKRGRVRGYFSDIPLDPKLECTHSMYPSVEHLGYPKNDNNVAVEARIINDMKSHLSEKEFWRVIEHLFAIGRDKGKIKSRCGKRLPKKWKPARNYTDQRTNQKVQQKGTKRSARRSAQT